MRDLPNLKISAPERSFGTVLLGGRHRKGVQYGAMIGALLLAVVSLFRLSAADVPACHDRPCTYYENNEEFAGKCGAQPGDNRCVCLKLQDSHGSNKIDQRSAGQPQNGCAIRK
jgi:hypothetical protein